LIKRILSIHFIAILLLVGRLVGSTITVAAVGDIMMGSSYPGNNTPPDNGVGLFKNVAPVLRDADLTLGNLEGTLLTGGVCAKKIQKGRCYAFRTPPEFAQNLVDAGFDYMNCANNHMNDFGSGGIKSTVEALEHAGIMAGGPYGNEVGFDINNIRVVIVSFATSPNANTIFEIEKAQRIVAEYSKKSDVTIVSFHGGGEGVKYLHTSNAFEYYMGWPRGNVVKFARAVVDSGADLVWGHGPHVPRALELYKGRLIAYSLGNFCTWGFNLGDERGLAPILKVELDSTGAFMSGQIISAIQRTYKYLYLDTLHAAAGLMKRLSESDFPDSAPLISPHGGIFIPPDLRIIQPIRRLHPQSDSL
jgi:hypothetical protein